MEKPIYVNLTYNRSNTILTKRVDRQFGGTFKELLRYMIDPKEDRLNPNEYSVNQKETANEIDISIKYILEEYEGEFPYPLKVYDINHNGFRVKLEDIVSDYSDKLYNSTRTEEGKTIDVRFLEVGLTIGGVVGGVIY